MAIVKGPAYSSEASGNVSGICFTRWRGLQVARGAWTGTVPNTQLQVDQQNKLIVVAQAWGSVLNEIKRQSYRNLARNVVWVGRLGDPYIPNGFQLFMKLNTRRLVMGLPIMGFAPVEQEWVYVHRIRLAVSGGIRIFQILSRTEGSEIGTEIFGYGIEYWKAGPYDSPGRRALEGEYRFLERKVPPLYDQDYDVVDQKWYWYRARQINEFGGVGNWFQAQIQFIAT